jgi:drug/metabolite transporter (DMT)-like permease
VLTIFLALTAALLTGCGFVIQQYVAAQAPPTQFLSPRLLLHLVRRPAWLVGIAVMGGGLILGAIALGRASLALVEPLLSTSLLFALPIAALWRRQRLGMREWGGAGLLIAGLAAFMIAADSDRTPTVEVPSSSWLIVGGCLAVVVGGAVYLARRAAPNMQGVLLGTAAGITVGLQDVLTNRVDHLIDAGIGHAVASWQTYTLAVVAAVGLLLDQSAFEAAPLPASLPGLTVAEPLTGIVLGATLLANPLRTTPIALAVEGISFVAVVTAVRILAHSPLIASARQLGTPEAATRSAWYPPQTRPPRVAP